MPSRPRRESGDTSRPKGRRPHEALLLLKRRALLAGAEPVTTQLVWERDAPHGSGRIRATINEVGFLEERPHTDSPFTIAAGNRFYGACCTHRADIVILGQPHQILSVSSCTLGGSLQTDGGGVRTLTYRVRTIT